MPGAVPEQHNTDRFQGPPPEAASVTNGAQANQAYEELIPPSLERLKNTESKEQVELEPIEDFRDRISEQYKQWRKLPQETRVERLVEVCDLIKERALVASKKLSELVGDLPDIDSATLLTYDAAQLEQALISEFVAEREVSSLLHELLICRTLLEQGPIIKGKREFRHATGFLDSTPRLSACFAAATSLCTLGCAVSVILDSHHFLVHLVQEYLPLHSEHGITGLFTPLIGEYASSWIGWAVHHAEAELISVIPLFVEATVLIGFGAGLGPKLYGLLKAGLGIVNRTFSRPRAEQFRERSILAHELQQKKDELIDLFSEAVKPIATKDIPDFYSRNQKLGEAIAGLHWQAGGDYKQEQSFRNLNVLHEQLGKQEDVDEWQALLIIENLDKFRERRIASVALEREYLRSQGEDPSQVIRPERSWQEFRQDIYDYFTGIWATADAAGVEAAIDISKDIDRWCHDNKSGLAGIAAPALGITSAVAHTLGVSIETRDSLKALREATKGVAEVATFDDEWEIAPGISDLVIKGLGFDIFVSDKKNKDPLAMKKSEKEEEQPKTFIGKTWKRFSNLPGVRQIGKGINYIWRGVTTALFFGAALPVKVIIFGGKKPIIIQDIKKEQIRSGLVSPEIVETEILDRHGGFKNLHHSVKDIAHKLKKAGFISLYKVPSEFVLRRIAWLHRNRLTRFTKYILPIPASRWISSGYRKRVVALVNGPDGINSYRDKKTPDGRLLRTLALSEIKNVVQAAKTEHYKDNPAYSLEMMLELVRYWKIREAAHWLSEQERVEIHREEISQLGVSASELKKRTKLSNKRQKAWLKNQSLRDPHSILDYPPVYHSLIDYITSYNKRSDLQPQEGVTLLDTAPTQQLVVKLPNGKLGTLSPMETRRMVTALYERHQTRLRSGSFCEEFRILDRSDEARLAVAGSMLGKLESHQQQALLEAHKMALSGEGGFEHQLAVLRENDLTNFQLFGVDEEGNPHPSGFPGIYRLGLIGNSIPSERIIDNQLALAA